MYLIVTCLKKEKKDLQVCYDIAFLIAGTRDVHKNTRFHFIILRTPKYEFVTLFGLFEFVILKNTI